MNQDLAAPAAAQRHLKSPFADWRLFAAAAGASLAAASAADASIIHVDPGVKPTATLANSAVGTSHAAKPFTIDGLAVSMSVRKAASQNFHAAYLAGSQAMLVGTPSGGFLKRFGASGPVSKGSYSLLARGEFVQKIQGAGTGGLFAVDQTAFAGFQLPASKGGGEGWLRVEIFDRNGNGYPVEIEAIDWAYNNAGGGITAGQTSAAPEPSTQALALLALGSAGVLAWRRRLQVG